MDLKQWWKHNTGRVAIIDLMVATHRGLSISVSSYHAVIDTDNNKTRRVISTCHLVPITLGIKNKTNPTASTAQRRICTDIEGGQT